MLRVMITPIDGINITDATNNRKTTCIVGSIDIASLSITKISTT